MFSLKMLTAAREATTKAKNVASAIQQAQRQVNDDNKDVAKKTDKNEQARAKKKAESELKNAVAAAKLAESQLRRAETQKTVALVQAATSIVGTVIGAAIDKKNRDNKTKENENGAPQNVKDPKTNPDVPVVEKEKEVKKEENTTGTKDNPVEEKKEIQEDPGKKLEETQKDPSSSTTESGPTEKVGTVGKTGGGDGEAGTMDAKTIEKGQKLIDAIDPSKLSEDEKKQAKEDLAAGAGLGKGAGAAMGKLSKKDQEAIKEDFKNGNTNKLDALVKSGKLSEKDAKEINNVMKLQRGLNTLDKGLDGGNLGNGVGTQKGGTGLNLVANKVTGADNIANDKGAGSLDEDGKLGDRTAKGIKSLQDAEFETDKPKEEVKEEKKEEVKEEKKEEAPKVEEKKEEPKTEEPKVEEEDTRTAVEKATADAQEFKGKVGDILNKPGELMHGAAKGIDKFLGLDSMSKDDAQGVLAVIEAIMQALGGKKAGGQLSQIFDGAKKLGETLSKGGYTDENGEFQKVKMSGFGNLLSKGVQVAQAALGTAILSPLALLAQGVGALQNKIDTAVKGNNFERAKAGGFAGLEAAANDEARSMHGRKNADGSYTIDKDKMGGTVRDLAAKEADQMIKDITANGGKMTGKQKEDLSMLLRVALGNDFKGAALDNKVQELMGNLEGKKSSGGSMTALGGGLSANVSDNKDGSAGTTLNVDGVEIKTDVTKEQLQAIKDNPKSAEAQAFFKAVEAAVSAGKGGATGLSLSASGNTATVKSENKSGEINVEAGGGRVRTSSTGALSTAKSDGQDKQNHPDVADRINSQFGGKGLTASANKDGSITVSGPGGEMNISKESVDLAKSDPRAMNALLAAVGEGAAAISNTAGGTGRKLDVNLSHDTQFEQGIKNARQDQGLLGTALINKFDGDANLNFFKASVSETQGEGNDAVTSTIDVNDRGNRSSSTSGPGQEKLDKLNALKGQIAGLDPEKDKDKIATLTKEFEGLGGDAAIKTIQGNTNLNNQAVASKSAQSTINFDGAQSVLGALSDAGVGADAKQTAPTGFDVLGQSAQKTAGAWNDLADFVSHSNVNDVQGSMVNSAVDDISERMEKIYDDAYKAAGGGVGQTTDETNTAADKTAREAVAKALGEEGFKVDPGLLKNAASGQAMFGNFGLNTDALESSLKNQMSVSSSTDAGGNTTFTLGIKDMPSKENQAFAEAQKKDPGLKKEDFDKQVQEAGGLDQFIEKNKLSVKDPSLGSITVNTTGQSVTGAGMFAEGKAGASLVGDMNYAIQSAGVNTAVHGATTTGDNETFGKLQTLDKSLETLSKEIAQQAKFENPDAPPSLKMAYLQEKFKAAKEEFASLGGVSQLNYLRERRSAVNDMVQSLAAGGGKDRVQQKGNMDATLANLQSANKVANGANPLEIQSTTFDNEGNATVSLKDGRSLSFDKEGMLKKLEGGALKGEVDVDKDQMQSQLALFLSPSAPTTGSGGPSAGATAASKMFENNQKKIDDLKNQIQGAFGSVASLSVQFDDSGNITGATAQMGGARQGQRLALDMDAASGKVGINYEKNADGQSNTTLEGATGSGMQKLLQTMRGDAMKQNIAFAAFKSLAGNENLTRADFNQKVAAAGGIDAFMKENKIKINSDFTNRDKAKEDGMVLASWLTGIATLGVGFAASAILNEALPQTASNGANFSVSIGGDEQGNGAKNIDGFYQFSDDNQLNMLKINGADKSQEGNLKIKEGELQTEKGEVVKKITENGEKTTKIDEKIKELDEKIGGTADEGEKATLIKQKEELNGQKGALEKQATALNAQEGDLNKNLQLVQGSLTQIKLQDTFRESMGLTTTGPKDFAKATSEDIAKVRNEKKNSLIESMGGKEKVTELAAKEGKTVDQFLEPQLKQMDAEIKKIAQDNVNQTQMLGFQDQIKKKIIDSFEAKGIHINASDIDMSKVQYSAGTDNKLGRAQGDISLKDNNGNQYSFNMDLETQSDSSRTLKIGDVSIKDKNDKAITDGNVTVKDPKTGEDTKVDTKGGVFTKSLGEQLNKQIGDDFGVGKESSNFAKTMKSTFSNLVDILAALLPALQALKKAMEDIAEASAKLQAANDNLAAAQKYANEMGVTTSAFTDPSQMNSEEATAAAGENAEAAVNADPTAKMQDQDTTLQEKEALDTLVKDPAASEQLAKVAEMMGLNPGQLLMWAQQADMLVELAEMTNDISQMSPFSASVQVQMMVKNMTDKIENRLDNMVDVSIINN